MPTFTPSTTVLGFRYTYIFTWVVGSFDVSTLSAVGYVILKPVPLENVVLLPLVVVLDGIGVGDGLVFVVQPAAVTANVISAAIASAVIRLRLSMVSALAYMESF